MGSGSSVYRVPRDEMSLDGWWHSWFDEAADWRAELPMLPSTPLNAMPYRPPTAGWDGMEHGMESLQVPGTWEASRPGYHGVGWHWRPIVIPEEWAGRAVRLRLGAARLRTEVYLDRRLVGYDLEGITPFEVDLTELVRPGKRHELALRITNPGGVRGAEDETPVRWAGLELPASHDFGGLWGSISLIGTARTYIHDLFAFPRADLSGATARCILRNLGPRRTLLVGARAYDAEGEQVAVSPAYAVRLGPSAIEAVDLPISIPEPHLWAPGNPYLYKVVVWLQGESVEDTLESSFGLRIFASCGGRLTLNGEPVFLRAADTANWYPGNLAFPTQQMAEREVSTALSMGLNALVARGQACPPVLLDAANRGGLLIVQGPGGVLSAEEAAWPHTQAEAFRIALLEERIRRLARRDRGHPALVCWNLYKEAGDPASVAPLTPHLVRLVNALREEDPTRMVSWGLGSADGRVLNAGPVEAMAPHGPAVGDVVPQTPSEQPPQRVTFYGRSSGVHAALADLPDLVARYGDRVLLGSDAEAWQVWRDALAEDFRGYGLERSFADLSAFCRATQAAATQALACWIEACRPHRDCAALSCGPWAPPAVPGFGGLVDIARRPQLDAERLRLSLEMWPLAIVGLPEQVYCGEPFRISVHSTDEPSTIAADGETAYELALAFTAPGGALTTRLMAPTLLARGDDGPIAAFDFAVEETGTHTVSATLLNGGAVLGRTERALWATRQPDADVGEVAVLGSEGDLAALESVPRVRWRRQAVGEKQQNALALGSHDRGDVALILERASAYSGRIALLMGDATSTVIGGFRALAGAVAPVAEIRTLALSTDWPGSWVFSHATPLLQGVADPGIWGSTHVGLLPELAVMGIPCDTLIGACAFLGGGSLNAGTPRIGTVLGVLPLGRCEVLFTTLPLLHGVSKRLPSAERLLYNIAAWLAEAC